MSDDPAIAGIPFELSPGEALALSMLLSRLDMENCSRLGSLHATGEHLRRIGRIELLALYEGRCEREVMWRAAQKIKAQLEEAGFPPAAPDPSAVIPLRLPPPDRDPANVVPLRRPEPRR